MDPQIQGDLPEEVRLTLQYMADMRDQNLKSGFYATAMAWCRIMEMTFNDWWNTNGQSSTK